MNVLCYESMVPYYTLPYVMIRKYYAMYEMNEDTY